MTVKFLSREESEHNECQRIELTFKTILVIHPQVFMKIRITQRLLTRRTLFVLESKKEFP